MSEHLPVRAGMIERLSEFMASRVGEAYPEPICDLHTELTKRAMDKVLDVCKPVAVLDVGCGQGPALEIFRERRIEAVGIALNRADVMACYDKGFEAREMDQNDLRFDDASFDLIWARHVLEHSIAPLWTLTEFQRVLRPKGWLYVEVPAPDTVCWHESNRNHYSVLGHRAWHCLLERAGFEIRDAWEQPIKVIAGDDSYLCFICRKL